MDCGYDFPTAEADACTLSARREALRALARDVAEAVQALQLPETYLEAERAARAVMVADRFVVCVREATLGDGEESYPSTAEEGGPPPQQAGAEKEREEEVPPPSSTPEGRDATSPCEHREEISLINETNRLRLRLRAYADRVMEAATFIPKPDSFLDGERAGRYGLAAERMLTQLYVRPAPKPSGALASHPAAPDEDEDEYTEDGRKIFRPRSKGVDPSDSRIDWADWQFELEEKLDRMAAPLRKRAEETGFWGDGKPYVPELPPDEPIRYNPDGSILSTRESELRRLALYHALQDAANKAHGWTPPPDPP